MKALTDFVQTPVGLFIRDVIEGGISTAVAAVLALNLDVATPKGLLTAALAGFIGGAIAVARRKLIDIAQTPKPVPQ